MATLDPTVTPAANAPIVSSEPMDSGNLQSDLAEGEARAASNVGSLDNYVSPSGGDSHIGAIEDRSGDTNGAASI